jgi:hypothetical protein
MAAGPQGGVWRRLAGLVFAGVLAAASYGLYLYVPVWLRGTFLQGLGNLVTFLAVVALLSLSERAWVHVQHWLHRDRH